MFFDLAWRNAKRSRNENLIYFLTMVTAVAAFYIALSLGKQDVIRFLGEIESDAVNRLLETLMPAVYLCALLFLLFLVIFANKYQLECRRRELGIYMILGMKKKRLFLQLMTECFITSLIALCGGILCGGFLSEVISLATARLVGQDIVAHQSSFSFSAVVLTILGFLLIQSVALFLLSGRMFKKEVYQLLYGETAKKHETGNIAGGFLTLILGIIALFISYWIVLQHFMAVGGAMLLVAVGVGIIGTLLFIRGLARLLSLWAGSIKNKSTHGLYTFTLRQVQENIVNKYVSIGVASILMMLTIVLIADGSASILSYQNTLTRGASIYDFTVTGEEQVIEQYLSSEQMKTYVSNLNRMETGNMKRPVTEGIGSYMDWSKLREQFVLHLPSGVKDPAVQEAVCYEISPDNPASLNLLGIIDTGGNAPYLLPLSAYNRLLEAAGENTLVFEDDEAALYLNPDFFGAAQEDAVSMLDEIITDAKTESEALISIEGKPFNLVDSVPMKGLTADVNVRIVTALIVPDEVFSKYVNPDSYIVYWSFCIPKKLLKTEGLMKSIMEAGHLLKPSGLVYESYLNNFGRQLFYVISGSYTTLYMGFMLLIIACALLALQFLTQMKDAKKRYLTLSTLGTRRSQMKKSMHRQVAAHFMLPLLLAVISGSVGICAMQKYLHPAANSFGQSFPFMILMAGIVILVLAVYAIAVARTADHEIGKLV